MVSKVRGAFQSFSGTVEIAERPEDSRADVTIDAASITTYVEMRDNHLRSNDFLAIDEHPTIEFHATGLEVTGDETFALRGDLTLRGVTRPVTLDARFEGLTRDLHGKDRAGFSATTEIDREDYGITWNQALESGGVLVGKKVRIELEVALTRKE
jgi:polyisoprenoid-binding protein YceI